MDGNTVESVASFVYHGIWHFTVSDGQCRPDLTRRIGLACAVLTSLKQTWSDKRLTLDTKLCIYQTLVLSVLLYAADTWTLLSADVRTLDAFRQKCLRQLLGIRRYDRVRNDEVLQRTGLTSLSHLLSRRRISVFGHVARLDDDTRANMALQLHINVSFNRRPDHTSTPPLCFLQAGCPSCRPTNSVKALLWIRCTILLGLQIVSTVDKILTDIARRGCRVSCYRTQTCDKQRDRHTTQPYLEC